MDRDQLQKLVDATGSKQEFTVSMKGQVVKWKDEADKVTGVEVTDIAYRDKTFFGDAQIPTEKVPLNRKGTIDLEGWRRLVKIRGVSVSYAGKGTWTEVDGESMRVTGF